MGATVTVVDARDRTGGRVSTIRGVFGSEQHAEAGGDLIDEAHQEIRQLAGDLNLTLARVLRGGWGHVTPDATGRPRMARWRAGHAWDRLSRHVAELSARYRLAERRADSPIAADLARRSAAQWLSETGADGELRAAAAGLSHALLADLDELSLLELVDEFRRPGDPAARCAYRIEGGNDRLITALTVPLGDRVRLGAELVAVSHRGRGVRASVKQNGQVSQVSCDYMVFALPATLLRRIPITPALPAPQHEAIVGLKYGRATRTLLQFSRRFWRAPARPRAFGLPSGTLREANEEQRGQAGILALTACGSAAETARETVATAGVKGIVQTLAWLGTPPADPVAWRQVSWDADPWARGGGAFVDPGFSPTLRPWLARPFGRIFFAGEHTSLAWRGSMNGAIESGRRAAAEIEAVHRSGTLIENR
jgi:monoamine oxidase